MDTKEKIETKQMIEQLGMTEQDVMEIGKEIDEMRINCIRECIPNLEEEIGVLKSLLCKFEAGDTIPDELIIPMHNLFCIVPEEQYQFLRHIKALFRCLPVEIKGTQNAKRIIDRLDEIKKDMVDTKMQVTDLSLYWSAYRNLLYTFGECDSTEQYKTQQDIRKLLAQITRQTINKRERGLNSAKFLLKRAEQAQ